MSGDEQTTLPETLECYGCHKAIVYETADDDEKDNIRFLIQELRRDDKVCPPSRYCIEYFCNPCRQKGNEKCQICLRTDGERDEIKRLNEEIKAKREDHIRELGLEKQIEALKQYGYFCSSCRGWDKVDARNEACFKCIEGRAGYEARLDLERQMFEIRNSYTDVAVANAQGRIERLQKNMFERYCAQRKAYRATQPQWTFRCNYHCNQYVPLEETDLDLNDYFKDLLEELKLRHVPLSQINLDQYEKLLEYLLGEEYFGSVVCSDCLWEQRGP